MKTTKHITNFWRMSKEQQAKMLDKLYNYKLDGEQKEHFDEWMSCKLDNGLLPSLESQHIALVWAANDEYGKLGF